MLDMKVLYWTYNWSQSQLYQRQTMKGDLQPDCQLTYYWQKLVLKQKKINKYHQSRTHQLTSNLYCRAKHVILKINLRMARLRMDMTLTLTLTKFLHNSENFYPNIYFPWKKNQKKWEFGSNNYDFCDHSFRKWRFSDHI